MRWQAGINPRRDDWNVHLDIKVIKRTKAPSSKKFRNKKETLRNFLEYLR